MKEFDLRPFEVKKKKYFDFYYEVYSNRKLIGDGYKKISGPLKFKNEIEALDYIKHIFTSCQLDSYHREHPIYFDYRIERLGVEKFEKWQWEDIQVGWFFKTSYGYIYLKHTDSHVICVEFGYYDLLKLIIEHKDSPECLLSASKITNVYDCPELAKMLMIERIET